MIRWCGLCVGGCQMGDDPDFRIPWPSSVVNNNVTNTCNSGIGSHCGSHEYIIVSI